MFGVALCVWKLGNQRLHVWKIPLLSFQMLYGRLQMWLSLTTWSLGLFCIISVRGLFGSTPDSGLICFPGQMKISCISQQPFLCPKQSARRPLRRSCTGDKSSNSSFMSARVCLFAFGMTNNRACQLPVKSALSTAMRLGASFCLLKQLGLELAACVSAASSTLAHSINHLAPGLYLRQYVFYCCSPLLGKNVSSLLPLLIIFL